MKKLIVITILLITTALTACSSDTKEEQEQYKAVEKQEQQDLFSQLNINIEEETVLNTEDTTENTDYESYQDLIKTNEEVSKGLRADIWLNIEEVEAINISDYSWYTALNAGEFFEYEHKLIIYALLKYYNNEVPYNFSCDTTEDKLEMPTGSLFKTRVHSDNPEEPTIDFYFDLYGNKIQVN